MKAERLAIFLWRIERGNRCPNGKLVRDLPTMPAPKPSKIKRRQRIIGDASIFTHTHPLICFIPSHSRSQDNEFLQVICPFCFSRQNPDSPHHHCHRCLRRDRVPKENGRIQGRPLSYRHSGSWCSHSTHYRQWHGQSGDSSQRRHPGVGNRHQAVYRL